MFRSANEDHSKWSEQLALNNLNRMCDLLEQSALGTNVIISENNR